MGGEREKITMLNFIHGAIKLTPMLHIDYWLISDCLDRNNITSNILTTPLTDHKAVELQISFKSSYAQTLRLLLETQ